MTDRSRITEDLVVVSTLECLVTKEVNGCVVNSAWQVLLVLNVLQTESLVPSFWKDIEGDLATNRETILTSAV